MNSHAGAWELDKTRNKFLLLRTQINLGTRLGINSPETRHALSLHGGYKIPTMVASDSLLSSQGTKPVRRTIFSAAFMAFGCSSCA